MHFFYNPRSCLVIKANPTEVICKPPIISPTAESKPQLTNMTSGLYFVRQGITIFEKA